MKLCKICLHLDRIGRKTGEYKKLHQQLKIVDTFFSFKKIVILFFIFQRSKTRCSQINTFSICQGATSALLCLMLASRPLDLVCPHSRLITGQSLNYKSVVYPEQKYKYDTQRFDVSVASWHLFFFFFWHLFLIATIRGFFERPDNVVKACQSISQSISTKFQAR